MNIRRIFDWLIYKHLKITLLYIEQKAIFMDSIFNLHNKKMFLFFSTCFTTVKRGLVKQGFISASK